MKFNELDITKNKQGLRVGRGIAAGRGKTAGRGTKGQSSRAGSGKRPGFEGGQTPLMLRLPKLRGFKSFKPKTEIVYTGQLNALKGIVDTAALYKAGLISSPHVVVKLVSKGELTVKNLDVKIQAASASAVESLQKSGGSFEKVDRLPREAKKKDKKA